MVPKLIKTIVASMKEFRGKGWVHRHKLFIPKQISSRGTCENDSFAQLNNSPGCRAKIFCGEIEPEVSHTCFFFPAFLFWRSIMRVQTWVIIIDLTNFCMCLTHTTYSLCLERSFETDCFSEGRTVWWFITFKYKIVVKRKIVFGFYGFLKTRNKNRENQNQFFCKWSPLEALVNRLRKHHI